MKKLSKLKYTSNRIFFITILEQILLGLTAVGLFFCAAMGDVPFSAALLVLAAFIGKLFISWCWILLPYRRSERVIQRILDGYNLNGDSEMTLLTPSVQALTELIEKILKSPQMMDLNKRQAQYLALQNQINPHFLYNTLESIRGEALIAGLDSVADMTEALAKFFRYTITKVENLVSVEEELDNCETYFWIQKYRFGERLQLHIEYDPEEWEEIMNCRIPKLTLQPILENSIIHGTELKVETGNIYIRFERTEERLIICISDDGVGMDEDTLTKLNRKLGKNPDSYVDKEEKQGGIALANVNNRIHLIFGEEYGMHVYSIPQSGTDVEISIPIVTSEQQIQNRSVLG